MRHAKTILRLLGVAVILMLASCGGGSLVATTGGGVGTGGTGISLGTVTGFGSLVVDGTTYNSATPQYFAGDDQTAQALAPSSSVTLGSRLQITLDGQGNPTVVLIEPELMGAVSGLTATGFTVNGVAVRANTNPALGPVTYYSGLSNFKGLANGMQVEVHGAFGLDANGQGDVQASLIAQLPSANPVTRITGIVSHWNPTRGSFNIGTETITVAPGATVLPSGMALADGELVNVWSNQPLGNGGQAVTASALRIRTLKGQSGSVQIGGLVANLDGTRFAVSGLPVDASAAALASTVQTLTTGEYVVVEGDADPSTGVVTASSIRPFASAPEQVRLHGTITNFVSSSNFAVRGVTVNAAQASFVNGSAASLGNGVFVDVAGSVSGNVVNASTVQVFSAAPEGGTVDYEGTVSQFNPATNSFLLTWKDDGQTMSSPVALAPNVAFVNGAAAQLVDGAAIEIEATNAAGALKAYTVTFKTIPGASGNGSSSGTAQTSGVVYGYDATAGSFQISGLTILIDGVVPTVGTLANGVRAEVQFSTTNGQNVAQKISIDD